MDKDQNEIQKKVITLFMINGHSSREVLDEDSVKKILDQRSIKIFNHPFKRQLLNQLIQKCKQSTSLNPDNLGQVIQDAYQILLWKIDHATNPNGYLYEREQILKNKEEEREILSANPRQSQHSQKYNLEFVLEQQINQLKDEIEAVQNDLIVFEMEAQIIKRIFIDLQLFQKQPQALLPLKNQSISEGLIIKIIYINLVGVFLQVFVSTIRPSFMNLMFYIHTFYLIFVGYYTRKSGMLLILQLITSVLCDLAYFAFQYIGQLNPKQHCRSLEATIVLIFQVFFGISILLRMIQLFLLCPFKQPPHSTNQIVFNLFGHQFILRKRIKINKNRYYGFD